MEKNQTIELFDTTLRDGTQGEGVNISIHDKLAITKRLDEFGVDIIEGGWPGSNPKDEEYFQKVQELDLKNAIVCAFGSTARFPDKIDEDNNLQKLVSSNAKIITIFGKTWRFHSEKTLGLTDEQNEELIYRSIKFLVESGRRVIFDAEHFFDGYKDDPKFAIDMCKAAVKGGADTIVLCDTNGGSLPHEVYDITVETIKEVGAPIGIHAHNDGGMAAANSIACVEAGAVHVQGTINGVGERCGNANLCTIIPNLILKMGWKTKTDLNLKNLTSLANFVYEMINISPNTRAPFVGKSAFAHKGGIHVSSVLKDSRMYEHIEPNTVGNIQRVIVSDLSGQSNIRYKAEKLGIKLPDEKDFNKRFVQFLKGLEYKGFQFDGAEASFELLLRAELNERTSFFKITYAKVNVMFDDNGDEYSEAVLKVRVGDEIEHTAADGIGPVNALDKALRKALMRFYPELGEIRLIDYKVRVLGEGDGTAAKVRVLIESGDHDSEWSTVGVSDNIIQASLQALIDSINYKLFKRNK
ncbi:(R)-citramalate synthase [hydrothermal vent metagenome]|uniref:(R)-citramalate synthase n=1 Tax=hydrothermal vent metagenome TaxID=652676 RepID=A0A3B1CFT7_9ZZZZ